MTLLYQFFDEEQFQPICERGHVAEGLFTMALMIDSGDWWQTCFCLSDLT